jgi:hypothetical protein
MTMITGRLQLLRVPAPLAMLVLLLQRSPAIQFLVRMEAQGPSGIGALVRSVFAVSMATGTVHALTGATTFSSTPASPAAATVGEPFTLTFSVTGAPTVVKSYHITGTLPPGLSIAGLNASGNLNAATGTISGTPTTQGSYTVNIQAYDRIDARGNTDDVLYPVRIDVAAGSATAPAITAQPAPLTLNIGGSGSFSVTATGSPAPTYQWRKGTTAIAGATSSTLSFTNVQTADAGSYSVVVTNSAGSITSNAVALTVNVPATAPAITTQPAPLTLNVGGSGSFSVTATGSPAPTYQWRKGTTAIAGATSATLSFTNVQTADAGSYSVVVTNSAGSITSNAVALTVNVPATAPAITAQPAPLTLNVGGSGSFSVTATGSPAPTYQWRKGTTAIAGATSATLSFTNVQTADAGSYSVVVTNSAGSVTSNAVALTVNAPATAPTITTQPRGLMLPVGYNGSLTVLASGSGTLSYRWNKNGVVVAGATSATLTLTAVQTGDAGDYTVVVSNANGSVTSAVARVSVGTSAARLGNLSSRGFVGVGNQVLIAGLVIDGSAPKSVLIRGVGPGLVRFGLAAGEVLADPVVSVKDSAGVEIVSNDNWGDAANAGIVPAVSTSVGAFGLASGSRDAVALVTLEPGLYTIVVRGANGETGIALAEAYELP